jgi:predicted RNase H-like HicB family nuclease
MIYPVYVHIGDDTHAHGVTIPDFPGCFSAADTWDELAKAVQEAIELHCEDEDMAMPNPTPLERLMNNPDYTGGVWLMIDVDLSQISTRSIRLNVSLPESLVHRIDIEAKARHMSRSAFLAMSAQQQIQASHG